MKSDSKSVNTKYIAVTAVLSAIAAILMQLEFSVPFVPSFLKLDFSELPALLASFICGPISGVLVCLIKNVFKLITTQTGGVGELCNFLLGASLVIPVGLISKKNKSLKNIVTASVVGALCMAVCSLPINYYISYPVYIKLFMPGDTILSLYRAIYPGTRSLVHALIIFNMPFTFIKAAADAAAAVIIYRRLPGREKNK